MFQLASKTHQVDTSSPSKGSAPRARSARLRRGERFLQLLELPGSLVEPASPVHGPGHRSMAQDMVMKFGSLERAVSFIRVLGLPEVTNS